jgi:hypothetical protein
MRDSSVSREIMATQRVLRHNARKEQIARGAQKFYDEDRLSIQSQHVPPLIDLDQIGRWRRACHATHGDCCNEGYMDVLSHYVERLILVDVTTNALVEVPASTPYVALSYVWGSVPMLKTQKSNFEDLKKPGALSADKVTIPRTIRDAMYLVKGLGDRYLWVDCLCIVQDEEQELMDTMLRAMARLYATAEFTIAAASGSDAEQGLIGIGEPNQDRTLEEMRHRHVSYVDTGKDGSGYPWNSKWASRGWYVVPTGYQAYTDTIFQDLPGVFVC